jgi:hypothetical protein
MSHNVDASYLADNLLKLSVKLSTIHTMHNAPITLIQLSEDSPFHSKYAPCLSSIAYVNHNMAYSSLV